MSEPRGGSPAAPTPSKLPGVLVLVGAGAVLVGTTFLPWIVGDSTRFLRDAGDNQVYASLGFFGASIVGGILGLKMLPRGSNSRLALVAILLALLVGSLIFIDYEAFTRRVARSASVEWGVAVGSGPYVAGVGAIVWIIGALVGFARRGAALASHGASTSMPPLAPPPDSPTPPMPTS